MTVQRVTLLSSQGWAAQPGRYIDWLPGVELEFAVEAATIEALRIGDWTVDPAGQVSGPPTVLRLGSAQSFASAGTYRLRLEATAS